MDVRLFAFLARQPSAALEPRERFCGLPRRGLALLMANVMFWQPIWAQADGIAVSAPGTSLGQAGNGVPIVNIAAPNGSGLSHNQFSDYNVGREGLILNNATGRTQSTQLGGIILGNANLQGRAASTILNEVNGANPSQLRGYTEVAGQGARVIVANPHGITCDGCGFINTPRVTLSTGKPIIENGQVGRYQVDGGAIAIEGKGLNASDVERFELITRSAKINARLHAQQLAIVTGRNDVDADTLKASARADDGSTAPALAIDSSALGGMYAGAIRLVGTEQGVGVRLAGDMAVDAGDLDIDSRGQLVLGNASAAGNLQIKAGAAELTGNVYTGGTATVRSSGDLEVHQSLASRQQMTVDAAQVRNHGVIEAGVEADKRRNDSADLTLTSQGLVNSGQVVTSRALTVTLDDTLVNQGGALKGQRQTLVSDTLDNRGGQVLADKHLEVTSRLLNNGQAGVLSSDGSTSVIARERLDNQRGQVVGGAQLTVTAGEVNNGDKGLIASSGQVTLDVDQLNNQGGKVSASHQQLKAVGLNNQDGTLVAKTLDATLQHLDNQGGSIVANEGAATVTASEQLNNNGGTLQANTHLHVVGGELLNQGGAMLGDSVRLDGQRLDNSQKGRVVAEKGLLQAKLEGPLNNQGGRLQATAANVKLEAASVDNRDGVVVGTQAVSLDAATGLLNNRAGQVLGARLELSGNTVDNQDNGQILAGSGGLLIKAGTLYNQHGKLLAGGSLAELLLDDGRLENQAGSLSASAITLVAGDADNSGGSLISLAGNQQLTVQRLINRNGLIEASQSIGLDGQDLDNSQNGRLIAHRGSKAHLTLSGKLDNRDGHIASGTTDLDVAAARLLNQRGSLEHGGQGKLALQAGSFNGSQGSVTGQGSGTWTIGNADTIGTWHTNGQLDISGLQSISLGAGERIASASDLRLAGDHLFNAGELLSDGKLTLEMNANLVNQGLFSSQKGMSLSGVDLTQEDGRIASAGPMTLQLSGALSNRGRLTSSQALDVRAASIDNQGTLGAQGKVLLRADGAIVNQQDSLLFAGGALELRGASLLNRYADIYSKGDLSFAALAGGRATCLQNLSGSIESEGNVDIKVDSLENAKEKFVPGETIASRYIRINCTDCSGGHHTGAYIVTTTYKGTVVSDSPAARLLANRNLTLDAQTVDNRQSLLAANGNLTANAQNFYNRGQTLDTRIEEVSYWLHGVSKGAYRVTEAATNAWNAQNAGKPIEEQAPIPTAVTMYPSELPNSRILPGTHTAYAGTVQAGGTVALNVSGELVNGTLDAHNTAQLTGKAIDSAATAAGGVRVTLGTQAGDPGLLKDVKRIETIAADGSTQVRFVPVDFSGAPFVSVDPTALSSFRLPQGEYGLFVRNQSPNASYLVESNPELTNLGRFMASDYMLGQLGFDADKAWRRLGDGRYETRLVADAVRAQTGQRFLADGLGSDYEQFKYLMDNALASKDALGLSVGVGLTSQQVAALTHDIVWMEERVVDGEKVLAPVLYLAKVDARNLRGGALVQGRDLELVTGGDLKSVGTLRASKDLSAVVGGSLYQGGLAQANEHLALMAQDSIRNALAGEIRGNQVDLVSFKGDIVNDRTATQVSVGAGSATRVDAGSLIDARSNLTMNAGGDLTNKGRISSGGNIGAQAGGDINLVAVQDHTVTRDALRRGLRTEETLTNLGSSLQAQGNVTLKSGGDINVVASSVQAGKNLDASATGDINVIAGQDEHSIESRYKKGGKKVHEVEEHSRVAGASLSAGENLEVKAGNDVNLVASKLKAGDEAYVYAGNDLSLIAGQERDYTLYDMKKKGSWGSNKAKRDEVTQLTHVGSEITSGGDLTLVSEGNQLYQRATLDSGKDLALISEGSITFAGVKDLHQESHTQSKGDLAWTSMKGKGSTDETLQQSHLLAKGDVIIQAVDGVKIDIRHIDQKSVGQTIDAMVAADPQLAWLKEAQKRGDVDWQRVQEVHDAFKYSHSGLGAGAQIIIAILIAYFTAGAASGLVASGASAAGASTAATTSGMWAAGTGASLQGIGWANAIVTAGAMGLTTNAAISTINNKGNLSLVLKDVTSKDALRGYAVSGITAGLTSGLFGGWMHADTSASLSTWGGIGQFAGNQLLQNGTSTVLDRALGGDSSLSDALRSSLVNTFAAAGFNLVGDISLPDKLNLKDGGIAKITLHALMGGLAAEAAGGDFKTGALAAGLNEALVDALATRYKKMEPNAKNDLLLMNAQLIGVLAAAAGGGDGADLQTGAWVAVNSTQFNYLLHDELQQMLAEKRACDSQQCRDDVSKRYQQLDAERNDHLEAACNNDPVGCEALLQRLTADSPKNQALADQLRKSGTVSDAFMVDYIFRQSNEQAQQQMAAQLSSDSPLAVAFAQSFLDSMVDSNGAHKPGTTLGIKGKGTGSIVKEPVYKTTQEATAAAKVLGYRKINETVHGGQAVYRKGKFYITRDLDGHNGGAWKMATSVADLGKKETRRGTYDVNLQRIGD